MRIGYRKVARDERMRLNRKAPASANPDRERVCWRVLEQSRLLCWLLQPAHGRVWS